MFETTVKIRDYSPISEDGSDWTSKFKESQPFKKYGNNPSAIFKYMYLDLKSEYRDQ